MRQRGLLYPRDQQFQVGRVFWQLPFNAECMLERVLIASVANPFPLLSMVASGLASRVLAGVTGNFVARKFCRGDKTSLSLPDKIS